MNRIYLSIFNLFEKESLFETINFGIEGKISLVSISRVVPPLRYITVYEGTFANHKFRHEEVSTRRS